MTRTRRARPTSGPSLSAAKTLSSGLRFELRRYPKGRVEAFVRSVGTALSAYIAWSELDDEASRLTELHRLKRELASIARALQTPIRATALPPRIDADWSTPVPVADADRGRAFYQSRDALKSAVADFQWHVGLAIHECRPRRAKKTADYRGLLARVARRYLELFGDRPTSTPGSTFMNVSVLILESATGKRLEDVSRHVHAALRAI